MKKPLKGDVPESNTGITKFQRILGFACAWIPYAVLVYHFRWICDDAFISFRYSKNLALGHGLRYNLGGHIPVEGYSNFLWVIICAIFEFFKANIEFWPLLLSFICGSILLYLVFITLHERMGMNLPLSCIATLFLGCTPPFFIWSTSGLETMAFALLFFITFERLILRTEAVAPVSAGIAGLAMGLMRVDGIYWAISMALVAVISRKLESQKARHDVMIYLFIVLVGYGIYWAGRFSYYQLPMANTVYVKVGVGALTLKRGFNYVAAQILTVPSFFVIVPGSVVALRKDRRQLGIAVAVIPIAVIAYAILVGGDFMAMARLLVPCLAFNALLFGWLISEIWGPSVSRKMLASLFGLVVTGIGLVPAWNIHLIPESIRTAFHFRYNTDNYRSEHDQWRFMKRNAQKWAIKGKLLKVYAEPEDSLVLGAHGAVGYYSGLFIYDQSGLVTRRVAERSTKEQPLRSPGHDKHVKVDFFLDEKPTFLIAKFVKKRRIPRRSVTKNFSSQLAFEILHSDSIRQGSVHIPDLYGRSNKKHRFLFLLKRNGQDSIIPVFLRLS